MSTHPGLLALRKVIDWKAKDKKLVQPRFVYVAVDNVAMGWAEIPDDLKWVIDGYFTVYVIDTWIVTYCCEITPSYWLEEVHNVMWFKDGVPDSEIDRIESEWCYGQDDNSCYVHCSVIERTNGAWAIIKTYDLDSEVPIKEATEEDLREAMEEAREAYQGNPAL